MFRLSLRIWFGSHHCFRKRYPNVAYASNRSRYETVVNPANVQFLVRLLGIEQSDAILILKNHKALGKLSQERITKAHAICLKYGIDNTVLSASPTVLLVDPIALERRINIFKDIGCPELAKPLTTPYTQCVWMTVKELKERQLLPADADVTKNLSSCLHEPPPDVPGVKSLSDDHTLHAIYNQVLRHYFQWKLELTDERANLLMTSRKWLRSLSFTTMRRMMDILEIELGFTKLQISKTSVLLLTNPCDVAQLLNELEQITGADTKPLLLKYPKVLISELGALQERLNILEQFDVNRDTILKYPRILTLASKTLFQRLTDFKAMPELIGYHKHPRILIMILSFAKLRKRMEILQQLNVRCASLHILTAGNHAFERYILLGSDRTKGKDLLAFLNFELDRDAKLIRATLKRHPLWCQIPVKHAHETLTYLKREHYSNQDILNNVHIVLYRSVQIEKQMEKIDSSGLDESWELTPSRKLAICLYYIEREYHFDGNGAWNCQQAESAVVENKEKQNLLYLRHTGNVRVR